jgi:alkylhydroperoxidase/carboxymuconolactone decarboxylase family protein YurZ
MTTELKDLDSWNELLASDPALAAVAPRLGEGDGGGPGVRLRALMAIACDVCDQTLGAPFEHHIEVALESGATRQDVKEAILHMGVYGAYPKCFESIARLKEIYNGYDAAGRHRTGDRVSNGEPEVNWVLDTGVREGLIEFDPQYGDLSSRMAGEVWGRPGLSPLERVYVSIAGDVCQQTLSAAGPFPFHVGLCLQNGLGRDDVRRVLLQLVESAGLPRVWQAFVALNQHFAALDRSERGRMTA